MQVVDLKTQLQYFEDLEKQFRQKLGDAKTNKLLLDAVYLFSCGGNDYLSPVGNNDSILYPYTHEQYVGMVIGNLTNVIMVKKYSVHFYLQINLNTFDPSLLSLLKREFMEKEEGNLEL